MSADSYTHPEACMCHDCLPGHDTGQSSSLSLTTGSARAPRTEANVYKAGLLVPERPVVFANFAAHLEQESAARLAVAEKLAIFATAYRSHPKRNPSDGLDAALAEFYALPKH